MQTGKKGRVFLIGAGPGDPDLITIKGLSLLNLCDVVVYDNLIPHELIVSLPQNIERKYVGKITDQHTLPQEQINQLLVDLAREGKTVARLKGGDPFVFGRGGEEAEFLRENDIEYEVVPGVTAGLAAAAYTGIPASHRDMSAAILMMTAHRTPEHSSMMSWECIGKIKNGTIIGYMGVKSLPDVVERLISEGMSPETESALIERACFPTQRVARAHLKDLPQRAKEMEIRPPAIFIIGDVAGLSKNLAWYGRDKALAGVRIMVTRPVDQSGWIYRILRGMGAEVLACPTIRTVFTEDKRGWRTLAEKSELDSWLVFSSENGVRYFFGYLKSKEVDLRAIASYKIAAAGSGTLRALNNLGYYPDFIPEESTMVDFAQEYSQKYNLSKNKVKIIRVRGKLDNDPVENILRQEGAQITCLDLYETVNAEWEESEIRRLFSYPPHMIVFSSGRAVNALVEILGDQRTNTLAEKSLIATIGPTTSEKVRQHGMEVALESSKHSIPDLITTIAEYYQREKDV